MPRLFAVFYGSIIYVYSPLRARSIISKIIGYIKMNASKSIHNKFGYTNIRQRGFYDHILRNDEDYAMHLKYISENLLKWQLDELYTEF